MAVSDVEVGPHAGLDDDSNDNIIMMHFILLCACVHMHPYHHYFSGIVGAMGKNSLLYLYLLLLFSCCLS